MILRLKADDYLRLRAARGVALEVLSGRVWITEDGCGADAFLQPGACYRVAGDGLVLVGAERDAGALPEAEIRVRAPSAGTAAPAPRAATAHPG